MPGLKDIAPSFRTVAVNGVQVPVPGISAHGIAYLFYRFPVVRELMGEQDVKLSPEDLMKLGPEAVSAIIAVGCGDIGDEEAEKAAAALPAELQVDFLEAVIGETMPSGVGPFVQRLSGLLSNLSVDVARTNTADGKSLSASNG